MLVHRRVTPSIKFAGTHLYTWVERGTVRVKCLAHEHNAMSPARSQTWTARSGLECTNHKATAPPTVPPICTIHIISLCPMDTMDYSVTKQYTHIYTHIMVQPTTGLTNAFPNKLSHGLINPWHVLCPNPWTINKNTYQVTSPSRYMYLPHICLLFCLSCSIYLSTQLPTELLMIVCVHVYAIQPMPCDSPFHYVRSIYTCHGPGGMGDTQEK